MGTNAHGPGAVSVCVGHAGSRGVLAVPISGRDIAARFSGYADAVVCLHMPEFFFAVGQGHCHFTGTSNAGLTPLLDPPQEVFREPAAAPPSAAPPIRDEEV